MSDRGWFKVHRKITKSLVWSDPNLLKLWMYCLTKARYDDGTEIFNGEQIALHRSQFVTGRSTLGSEFNRGMKKRQQISEDSTWRMLKKLSELHMLEIESTSRMSIVTVRNYDVYQNGDEDDSAQLNASPAPANRQQTATSKEVKNNNNTTRKKREYDESSSSFKLAKYLYLKIQENDPNAKEPNFQTWADDARKLMDLDKRSKENIYNVINWCQQDEFWSSNILSVKKLRSQFTQLFIKMNKDTEWLMRNTKQVSAGHEATDMNDLDRQQEENLRRAEEKYRKEHPELNE